MRTQRLRVRDLAEGAVLVEYPGTSDEEANRSAIATARSLLKRQPAGFLDAVPGARTLFVAFDPRRLARGRLVEELRRRAGEAENPSDARRALAVPVLYGGPDLEELARAAAYSPGEFVRRHASGGYRVAFLGFAPGFAYLTGLPKELHAARLATPRTRVPAGSVGIGGPYTGIYPEESPGGWRLIGRAPVRLFDADRDPPALLFPGDSVAFEPIDRNEFERRRPVLEGAGQGDPRPVAGPPLFRVAAPGVFTSVQGTPRRGWAIYGVPPGGAMDHEALACGNALVGNPAVAPALEMTLSGPDLEVLSDATIALSGGRPDAAINGRPVGAGAVCEIRKGDRVRVGSLRGAARAYLCVSGGLAQIDRRRPSRRLTSGDTIFLDARPGPRAGETAFPARPSEVKAEVVVRVFPGPQREHFENAGLKAFLDGPYRVSVASDRRGIRLEGPVIVNSDSPEIPPEGTALGSIQVPRDGQPIVLGPDRPVTGGYAKIATVVAADFPLLARALPGTAVRFREVTGLGPRPAGSRIT